MIKKLFLALVTIGILVSSVSCSAPKEDKEEKTTSEVKKDVAFFKGELSEKEMESAHLGLDLNEKVSVDADITSYSKYKDGLNSYFIEKVVQKQGKVNLSLYQKNPTFFENSLSELEQEITGVSTGKFLDAKKVVEYQKKAGAILFMVPYRSADGTKRNFFGRLNIDKKKRLGGVSIVLEKDYTEEKAENNIEQYYERTIGEKMRAIHPDCDMSDLSIGKKEEIGERLSGIIKNSLELELAEGYDCMPLNRENYHKLANRCFSNEELQPLESEYYLYTFYPAVDGFLWRARNWSQKVEDKEVADDVLVGDSRIYTTDEATQKIVYGEDGIRELELTHELQISEVYKKQEICSIETVLTQLQDYFGEDSLSIPTTIYNIEICYSGDFSDEADGKIRNIVQPYWYVEFWKQCWDGKRCSELWLDAVTGECLSELEM